MVAIPDSLGPGPSPAREAAPLRFVVREPVSPEATPLMAADALEGVGDALQHLLAVLRGQPDPGVDASRLASALDELDRSLPAMSQHLVQLLVGYNQALEHLLGLADPAGPSLRFVVSERAPASMGAYQPLQPLPALKSPLPPVAFGMDQVWSSITDPHERTAEGMEFETKSGGTFVALRSQEGDLEVQKVVGPHPLGWPGVFNLAVAIKVGPDQVLFDAATGRLLINMIARPWQDGALDLPGGGRVRIVGDRLVVTSPRFDTVTLIRRDHFLNLTGKVAGARIKGSVRGLMGAFDGDGDPNDDLVTREGKVVGLQDLLAYEESWRVRPGESLFPGASLRARFLA